MTIRGGSAGLLATAMAMAMAMGMTVTGCAALGTADKAAPAAATGQETAGNRTFVYTGLSSGDIVVFELNTTSGALTRRGSAAGGRTPSSLARSEDRQVLIAADEGSGTAVSLSINPKNGSLTPIGRASTGGSQPSEVTVDATGKYALVANSGSGSASVLAIKPNGTLDQGDVFAAAAGAHAIAVHPANDVAFVANFRAGTVSQYKFNTGTGTLTPKPGPPLGLPAGSGPTHFACHPSGRWVYILSEANDTISVHVFDEDIRALSVLASQIISTVPDAAAAKKNKPGDLRLGRGGKFLYATNRGHDSIATFEVEGDGTLKLVGHQPSGGRTPWALAVDPGGEFLIVANNGTHTLAVFRLDPTNGAPLLLTTVPLPAAPLAIHVARP